MAEDPASGHGASLPGERRPNAPSRSRGHDRPRQRMLRRPLEPRGAAQHLVGRRAVGLDRGDAGGTRGERAGLVEGDHAHAGQRLQDLAAADEAAAPRQPPDAERGRQRRRPDPARRDRPRPARRGRRAAPGRAAPHRAQTSTVSAGEDQHGRNERARDPIRQALRVARLGQGLAHGAGDLAPSGSPSRRPCCG